MSSTKFYLSTQTFRNSALINLKLVKDMNIFQLLEQVLKAKSSTRLRQIASKAARV